MATEIEVPDPRCCGLLIAKATSSTSKLDANRVEWLSRARVQFSVTGCIKLRPDVNVTVTVTLKAERLVASAACLLSCFGCT